MTRTFAVTILTLVSTFAAARVARAEPAPEVLQAEADRIEVIRKASAAFIAVFANAGQGGGSGVVITPDGYALSNFHVTKPAGTAMKCGMNDGKLYDAVIISVDPTGDVALLKLLGRDDFPTAEMGDSDEVKMGDWCFAVGNPFLLANDFHPTVSYGLVSGTHRYQPPAGTLLEYGDCIQTDAAINPGNSGGPLFNAKGELIGINGRGSFEKRGRVNVGVGYAISINQIKKFLGAMRGGLVVDHATLGATVSSSEDGRVLVNDVLPDSDAERRGLQYGDEIVRFGGREIKTVNAFMNVLCTYPKGWRVPLTYRRDGETFNVLVRLRPGHHPGELEEAAGVAPAKKPEGQPEGGPRVPGMQQLMPGKPSLPKIVADHYEARPGFMNYYFNRLERDRVWKAFSKGGDYSKPGLDWTATGELTDEQFAQFPAGKEMKLALEEKKGTVTFPFGESAANFGLDLTQGLGPHGSGGMLQAMHVWQRLLTSGPEKFGEVYYLGTTPIPTQDEWVDVLAGIYGGVETHFYFDRESGRLVGLEMFTAGHLDPCEIYFGDFREADGKLLPHQWDVRSGDVKFAEIKINDYKFGK